MGMEWSTGIDGGRTRIAPTPSGYLHMGNAFNFLLTSRLAAATGSAIVLRIDDLDAERTRPEYVEDIYRSLEWLGITVDEGPSGPEEFSRQWSQTRRVPHYLRNVDRLRQAGALYACGCSRVELQAGRRHGSDHACRSAEIDMRLPDHAWRLRIPKEAPVHFQGLSGEQCEVDLALLMDDPVILQRESGRPSYQVASLTDDLEMGISFVVRGLDLWPSTACQVYLSSLLGGDPSMGIRFHHHPLTMGADGLKLSKSAGASSLKVLREARTDPSFLYREVDGYLKSEFGLSS